MEKQLKLFATDVSSKKIYYTVDFSSIELSVIMEQLDKLTEKLLFINLGLVDSYGKR